MITLNHINIAFKYLIMISYEIFFNRSLGYNPMYKLSSLLRYITQVSTHKHIRTDMGFINWLIIKHVDDDFH